MRQWGEGEAGEFSRKLFSIVKELENEAATIAKLVEEGERQAEFERQRMEEQRREWEREAAEQRRIKAKEESREELIQIITDWAEAKRIEEFFVDAERWAINLKDEERELIVERLKVARELVGGTDALEWFMS